MTTRNGTKVQYLPRNCWPLMIVSGLGGILGSGTIVGLSATITVIQQGFSLTTTQVGILSALLTFMIGVGSLFGGRIADVIGRTRVYNYVNFVYAAGALLMMLAQDFTMLLIGVIILGLTSGIELPVSLTMMSRDSSTETVSSHLVSSHQIFWEIGQFISYIAAFALSATGVLGARFVFAILLVVALVTALWRTLSRDLNQMHLEGDRRAKEMSDRIEISGQKGNVINTLFHSKLSKWFFFSFMGITIYYVFWNLMANTYGQFQTYLFRQEGATQTLATGLGLAMLCLQTVLTVVFSAISGNKGHKFMFWIGGILEVAAMLIMAIGGTLWFVVGARLLYGFGTPFAGEAIYKVWTQNSFPADVRASIQGYINGFSRVLCAIFALFTPALLASNRIHIALWIFVLIVLVAFVAGIVMLTSEKRRTSILSNTGSDA